MCLCNIVKLHQVVFFFRLNEGGFVAKWTEMEMNKVARLSTKKKERPKGAPLSVTEIQGALVAYLAVASLAILVFLIENCIRSRPVRVSQRHQNTPCDEEISHL